MLPVPGIRPLIEYLSSPFWVGVAERYRKGKLILLCSLASWLLFTMSFSVVHPPAASCITFNQTHHLLYPPHTKEIDLAETEAVNIRPKRNVNGDLPHFAGPDFLVTTLNTLMTTSPTKASIKAAPLSRVNDPDTEPPPKSSSTASESDATTSLGTSTSAGVKLGDPATKSMEIQMENTVATYPWQSDQLDVEDSMVSALRNRSDSLVGIPDGTSLITSKRRRSSTDPSCTADIRCFRDCETRCANLVAFLPIYSGQTACRGESSAQKIRSSQIGKISFGSRRKAKNSGFLFGPELGLTKCNFRRRSPHRTAPAG